MAGSERVVLDTNVAASALLFVSGRVAKLRAAWEGGAISPLASRATIAELIRVLAYPKFGLTPGDRDELLGDYLPYCSVIVIGTPPPAVPACRDPHDTPFLELAVAGRASALVTGDSDLLALRDRVDFEIIPPADFLARL